MAQVSRVLIAKQDGVPDRHGSAFAPGAIRPTTGVPITRDFDPRRPPIGLANIVLDGDDVYAEFDLDDVSVLAGLTPAVGGRSHGIEDDNITSFDVIEVSFCSSGNTDARIPAFDHRKGVQ